MSKLAMVFPGQGSQYIGMGRDFYDNFEIAKDIFQITNKALGYDLADIIFNGTDEHLKQTEITQPAIYTISYIIYKILEQKGIKPDFFAGHSLGEYTALTASGILSFEDGIKLVQKRGEFIKNACLKNKGGMIAVLGLNVDEIEKIIKNLNNVEIANYNSPAQTVISYKGDDAYADEISSLIKAKLLVKLKVSGPFHSSFMQSASDDLNKELNTGKYEIKLPKVPVVFNYSAKADVNLEQIRENIVHQVKSSVQWIKSIEFMVANCVSTIVEVGPGKVLSGLNKKINSDLKVLNVEKLVDLEGDLICQKN